MGSSRPASQAWRSASGRFGSGRRSRSAPTGAGCGRPRGPGRRPEPVPGGTCGTLAGARRHDQHAVVQHLVVLDVRPQRQRRGLLARVREHRGARHPGQRPLSRTGRRRTRRAAAPPAPAVGRDDLPAAPPRRHHGEDDEAIRAAAASRRAATLDRLAARKVSSTPPKATAASASFHGASATAPGRRPAAARVDDQRAGDRDAVGGGQPLGGPERQHDHEHADEQQRR
jgi:hypothetical protein